jgi:hypothetical protein
MPPVEVPQINTWALRMFEIVLSFHPTHEYVEKVSLSSHELRPRQAKESESGFVSLDARVIEVESFTVGIF